MTISRRGLLASLAMGGIAAPLQRLVGLSQPLGGRISPPSRPAVPMLLCTDLYRPFADPDDHFDLATVYALMQQGHYDIRAILIDYPPPKHNGDPDVQAVAQLNAITGHSVPVAVGSPRPFDGTHVVGASDLAAELARAPGATTILDVLRRSAAPVVIHIAGSSRDVAIAARAEPRLFAQKCAAVYLNAGSGTRDTTLARRLEYNVDLDPVSYAAIFDLPCPVYWLPCFEVGPTPNGEGAAAGAHSSLYSFPQKEILPLLSDRLHNYFSFAYRQGERNRSFEEKVPRANWLHALDGKRDEDAINFWSGFPREMWCTAGFLHAVGIGVRPDGSMGTSGDPASVFAFEPIDVRCSPDGVTSWGPHRGASTRHILTVRDQSRYPTAMTAALLQLLRTLK